MSEEKEEGKIKRDGLLDAPKPFTKPCRAVREDKYPQCGDLPGMAPEGKCYFDHQKDCNAWCLCWEGDEDTEEVKNIREIQNNIKNCGLPKYKVVED